MRTIKLTEKDLRKIVNKVIQEQKNFQIQPIPQATSDYLGRGGEFERSSGLNRKQTRYYDFKCLPSDVKVFGNYVANNKQKLMNDLKVDATTLLLLSKAAMGIIGRETTFGEGTEFKDDATEFLINWGLGIIPKTAQAGWNKVRQMMGKDKQQMSLGAAQFTEDTWNSYGLDKKVGPYENSFNALKQGIGALHRINDDYKRAIKIGAGTGPSVNPIAVKQGKIKSIDGTGNNAMDLAIVSHNMSGLIDKWCQTNDPNYAGPCGQSEYQPFPTSKKDFKLKVYQDKPLANYFPNKGSGQLTSIGYLEEVANYIKKFDCFTI